MRNRVLFSVLAVCMSLAFYVGCGGGGAALQAGFQHDGGSNSSDLAGRPEVGDGSSSDGPAGVHEDDAGGVELDVDAGMMMDEPDLSIAAIPDTVTVAVDDFSEGKDDAIVGSCDNRKMGQGFVPTVSGRLSKVFLQIRKIGLPVDGLIVKIYEGGMAPEAANGKLIATSDEVLAANLQAQAKPPGPVTVFAFAATPIQAGVNYFMVVERTGKLDCNEINVYRVGTSIQDIYPKGKAWTQWKGNQPADWLFADLSKIDLIFKVEALTP